MASSSQRIMATFEPHVADAIAIFRGISLAQDIGILEVEEESNAKLIVDWINDNKTIDLEIDRLISSLPPPPQSPSTTHCQPPPKPRKKKKKKREICSSSSPSSLGC
ncbi:hypothetical protein LWI28_017279 [Acer negundo]|uniref:RNase H type-1 domain-containing protein n=1 Tax=Acer negundo TaxID=4023 RepID=A0AAD5IK25_ACENE|nr:hypothetical protein LWI28_017279 [Acer negundo]